MCTQDEKSYRIASTEPSRGGGRGYTGKRKNAEPEAGCGEGGRGSKAGGRLRRRWKERWNRKQAAAEMEGKQNRRKTAAGAAENEMK